jgi:hypothetical protein
VLAFLLVGCERGFYQSIETKKGEALLFNRFTGTLYKVTDEGMVEVEKVSISDQKKATTPRSMVSRSLPGHNVSISLRIRYLDNQLFYVVRLEEKQKPEKQDKDKKAKDDWIKIIEDNRSNTYHQIAIELEDQFGFNILVLPVFLSQLIRTIDDNGDIIGYSFQGKQGIKFSTYQDIHDWTFTWNFKLKIKGKS